MKKKLCGYLGRTSLTDGDYYLTHKEVNQVKMRKEREDRKRAKAQMAYWDAFLSVLDRRQ